MECESVLEQGAEVSAKFRGAYCEAVVKRVSQANVEVRVKFIDEELGVHSVSGKHVRGKAKVNQTFDVRHPDDGQWHRAVVQRIIDSSVYFVGMWATLHSLAPSICSRPLTVWLLEPSRYRI